MSGPGGGTPASGGATKQSALFGELWTQLGECHRSALRELEAKVSKLKKDRCLDAQRLEEFYSRNQRLKEQQKALQESVGLLEERLRAGVCDRCAVLEENLTAKSAEYEKSLQQNLHIIAKLKSEKARLHDDNLELKEELEKLKASLSPEHRRSPSPEQEEGVIPDSPVLPASLPLANKLKRRKRSGRHASVHYAETPLLKPSSSLFYGLDQQPKATSKSPRKPDTLVPETCQMDTSLPSQNVNDNLEEVVAETCAMELPVLQRDVTAVPQSILLPTTKSKVRLRPRAPSSSVHYPQSSPGSPPPLPCFKRPPADDPVHRAKRRKEATCSGEEGEDDTLLPRGGEGEPSGGPPPPAGSDTAEPPRLHPKGAPSPGGAPAQRPAGRRTGEEEAAEQELHAGKPRVEPMWSMDPALALSMYQSQAPTAAENSERESADPDCTFVSHTLLQGRGANNQEDDDGDEEEEEEESILPVLKPGPGQGPNDSLDRMFDATAYGEYNSHFEQPCHEHGHDDDDDDDDYEDEEEEEHRPPGIQSKEQKGRNPTFAHVAVVRKKDERRKLKGSTCKECDIYYAHLPEEERRKKLSACSRHRFLYIPPSTPENFWEVGFPSTQTCIERGYIKEEKNPQARMRRRQPLAALFSPKRKEPEA